jgi:hypothetical protein
VEYTKKSYNSAMRKQTTKLKTEKAFLELHQSSYTIGQQVLEKIDIQPLSGRKFKLQSQ